MSKQQGRVIVATKKLIKGPNGEIMVTVESLDDIIRNAKKITSQKNFVPGNPTYEHGCATLKGFLMSAVQVTTALINDNNMDTDKYNLLSCKTKSFGTKNDLCNQILREIKEELAEDAKINKEVNPADPENAVPFTEEQIANIQANPKLADPESHEVEETTKDGGRMKFDKVNFEIHVYLQDGTVKTIQLAPEGSWRQTIAKWLIAFIDAVSVALTTAKDSIISGFNKFTGLFKKKPVAKVNQEGEVVPLEDQVANAAKPKEEKVVAAPKAEPNPVEAVEAQQDEVVDVPESTQEKSADK
mgnify:FL=1